MVIIENFNQYYESTNFIGKTYDGSYVYFIKNNKYHRFYGPAVIGAYGVKIWYFNGYYHNNSTKKYNQKQFMKGLNKQWLS